MSTSENRSSRTSQREKKEVLIGRVLDAGRVNGARSIMFQQTVGQILGLNATDMKCLDVIYRNGPASPTILAGLTGLTTGAVTILIDRLEKSRLIERRPDPDDRRRTVLIPTQEAMRKVPRLYQSMGSAMASVACGFSENELKAIESFFVRTAETFKRETEKLRPLLQKTTPRGRRLDVK